MVTAIKCTDVRSCQCAKNIRNISDGLSAKSAVTSTAASAATSAATTSKFGEPDINIHGEFAGVTTGTPFDFSRVKLKEPGANAFSAVDKEINMDYDVFSADSVYHGELPFSCAGLLDDDQMSETDELIEDGDCPLKSRDPVNVHFLNNSELDETDIFAEAMAVEAEIIEKQDAYERDEQHLHDQEDELEEDQKRTRSRSRISGALLSPQRTEESAHFIPYEDIEKCFHLPLAKACKALGIGMTCLKRKCRQYKIRSWPYRKLKSIDNLIDNIRSVVSKDPARDFTSCVQELEVNHC